MFFAYTKMLGRTDTRTRERMYCQTIRTVRDISRDDRAIIATCSLRTPTDRLKENYSIDEQFSLPQLNARWFASDVISIKIPQINPCKNKNSVLAYLIVFSEYGMTNASISSVALSLTATQIWVKRG